MNPRHGCSRRAWLTTAAMAALSLPQLVRSAETLAKPGKTRLGMPGLHPGRVVAVSHPASIVAGKFRREPINAMLDEGMLELTGADDPPQAWKQFFERGEVVGIKLTPVGGPLVMSSAEVLQGIIAGLESAGVRRKDIVVYDRYRDQFINMGMDQWLPERVRWSFAANQYDEVQQGIDGYDPDHYMDLAVVLPGQDPSS